MDSKKKRQIADWLVKAANLLYEDADEQDQKESKDKVPTKDFILWYADEYRKKYGSPLMVAWGQDGELVKKMLRVFGDERLRELVSAFFALESHWTDQRTIGVFYKSVNALAVAPQKKEGVMSKWLKP